MNEGIPPLGPMFSDDDPSMSLPGRGSGSASGSSSSSGGGPGGRSLSLLFAPSKAVRVVALFLAYDLFRDVHLVPAFFLVKLM